MGVCVAPGHATQIYCMADPLDPLRQILLRLRTERCEVSQGTPVNLWAETAEFQDHYRHEPPAFFEIIKLLKSDHSAVWQRTTGESLVFLFEIDFISSLHSNQASDFVFSWSLNIFSAVDMHNISIALSCDVPYTPSVFFGWFHQLMVHQDVANIACLLGYINMRQTNNWFVTSRCLHRGWSHCQNVWHQAGC